MATRFTGDIFINLPVRDLDTSKTFFAALGFKFDPKYTDDNAACMILNEHAYVMLLREAFFRSFTRREPCNTTSHSEALLALACDSREAVDDTVKKAIAAGGSDAMPPMDHGFMYGWSFYDPDGHHWEVFWMNAAAASS